MGDREPRFDVVYRGDGSVDIEYHHCREWDESGGCYGTNPNHGFSFDEARAEVDAHHRRRSEYWRTVTLREWSGELPTQDET